MDKNQRNTFNKFFTYSRLKIFIINIRFELFNDSFGNIIRIIFLQSFEEINIGHNLLRCIPVGSNFNKIIKNFLKLLKLT